MAPPQRQGVFSALVMGILEHLDIASLGHYSESAETLYYLAHALRRAEFETGLLNDPEIFDVPTDVWLSADFQRQQAEILRRSKPTRRISPNTSSWSRRRTRWPPLGSTKTRSRQPEAANSVSSTRPAIGCR